MGDESKLLTQLAAYLASGTELEEDALLRLMMEVGVSLVRADEGSLLLVEKESQELIFKVTVGSDASQKKLEGQRVPLHEGIVGLVATTGEAQTGAPRYHGVEMLREEPRATLAAPITVGEEVIGVLTAVRFGQEAGFAVEDLRLYTQFGQMCGLLIRQRLREEQVRRILTGEKAAAYDHPILRSLMDGPLGAEQRLVETIAKNLANISHGRADVLELCEELVETVAKITKALEWRAGEET